MTESATVEQVHDLLARNYVEDDDEMFRCAGRPVAAMSATRPGRSGCGSGVSRLAAMSWSQVAVSDRAGAGASRLAPSRAQALLRRG